MSLKDIHNRDWIIKHAVPIVNKYSGTITLRGLHYKLLDFGMPNTMKQYKKVVTAMIKARWDGTLGFDDFVDHDRETLGKTKADIVDLVDSIEAGQRQVKLWMECYSKNRWENQRVYPEVFIEKKALIGSFQEICDKYDLALNPCKGYPSLTFLHEAKLRFENAISNGKEAVILYFGDYDPSGEDIPRSIRDNLLSMGVDVKVQRVALMEHQVVDWNLPPAPAKLGDSRTAKWDGLGQVELDAVSPEKLYSLCESAILEYFDNDLYVELLEAETNDRKIYRRELKSYVGGLE